MPPLPEGDFTVRSSVSRVLDASPVISRRAVSVLLPIVLSAGMLAAQGPASQSLEIYVIDTEGGKATLYVAPGGQTVLVDSGNPGGRDTDRIMAALSDAGATKIDYLVSTHYHVDHVGGLQELAGRIPIGTFVDHGATVEGPVTALREQVPGFQVAYAALHAEAKHLVVKAGDRLPVSGRVRPAPRGGEPPVGGGGRPSPCQGPGGADRSVCGGGAEDPAAWTRQA